jgi:hypothetical protein
MDEEKDKPSLKIKTINNRLITPESKVMPAMVISCLMF